MRVLLIDPPYTRLQNVRTSPYYPSGPAHLASSLTASGHEALYVNLDWDARLPFVNPFSSGDIVARNRMYLEGTGESSAHPAWGELEALINDYRPDMLGVSFTSIKAKSAFKAAKLAKRVRPETATVFGGHHSQVYAREILENLDYVDYVVLDEGEETLCELAGRLSGGAREDMGGVHGLAYRRGAAVMFNERRPLMADISSLPPPSDCHSYLDMRLTRIPALAFSFSRGCPYSCGFCASNNIWRRTVRWRSPRAAVDSIKAVLAVQKGRYFSFYDDCFTLNREWLTEFCRLVAEEGLGISWECLTNVKLVDEEVLGLITEAGCIKINIGVESGSERILEFVGKGISLDDVRRVFRMAKARGLSTCVFMMMGFPTETEEEMRKTQALISELSPNWVYCTPFVPLPGTRMHRFCVENGQIAEENAWTGEYSSESAGNYTTTMSDEAYLGMLEETFRLCYRLNARPGNLIRRAPLRQYVSDPLSLLTDARAGLQYLRHRGGKP